MVPPNLSALSGNLVLLGRGGGHTWWSYGFNARAKNIGWRIDYFVVSSELKHKVLSSKILKEVKGSDHVPIRLILAD